MAIVAYALPSYLGGNGFLAVYLAGIVLGASDITGKVELAHFFDTLTEMAEMTIFFCWAYSSRPRACRKCCYPAWRSWRLCSS